MMTKVYQAEVAIDSPVRR